MENDKLNFISTTRYAFDTWKKLFPESDKSEWEKKTRPNDLVDFVCMIHDDMMTNVPGKVANNYQMRVVTLDDEYLEWLGDREDNNETRTLYVRDIPDADCDRIAKENGLNYTYNVCLYPIYLSVDEFVAGENRFLSKTTRKEFESYLKLISPKSDVYVLPYCLDMEYAVDHEEEIINLAKHYFSTGKEIERFGWRKVQREDFNELVVYSIPIVFRETHDSMIFTPNYLLDASNGVERNVDDISMNKEFFDSYGVIGVPEFLDTDLPKKIKKDLKMFLSEDDDYDDFLVATFNVVDFYDVIEKSIEGE